VSGCRTPNVSFFINLSGRANDSPRRVRQIGKVNYSEQLAFQYLAKTRAMVADPAFTMVDWSTTIFMVSLAVLVFVCMLAASE